jgi:hypothetical protein
MDKRTLSSTAGALAALSIAMSAAIGAVGTAHGDTILPEYERGPVHVASGSSAISGIVTVADEARLVKTGAGTATLDTESVVSPNAPRIDVLDGRLEIGTNGGTPAAVAEPTALLDTAMLWLAADADHAHFVVVTSNDTQYVDVWRDVRDTDASVTNYPYARTPLTSSYGLKSPMVAIVDGKQCLDFGGFGSKRTMWLYEAESQKTVGAATIFAVTKIAISNGHLLGNTGTHMYQTAAFGSGSLAAPYYDSKSPAMRALRFFDNGERRDVGRDWPQKGLRIYEWCHSAKAVGSFNAIFTQSNGWVARQGGDYLMELIAFAAELSESDRLAVERYLMAKWGVSNVAADVRVASGATASVAASGLTVRPSGEGVVEASASGLVFETGDAPVFGGEVKLAYGVPAKIYGPGIPLSLSSGDSISVVRAKNTTDFGRETATLSKTAPAGTAEKTGTGTARVASLPVDVTKLDVKGGRLVLAAPVADAMPDANGAVVVATIPNGDFESSDMSQWTLTGDGSQGRYISSSWKCPYPPPQGSYALCLKRSGSSETSAETTVTVPVDGRYELSFLGCGRSGFQFGTYNVKFISGMTTVDCGTVDPFYVPNYGGYRKFRVQVPELTAGTWTMHIEPNFDTGDVTTTLDDFRMTLVTEKANADGAWPLPNGGFENLDKLENGNDAWKNSINASSLYRPEWSASNSIPCWTFDRGGASPMPAAGMAEEAMFFNNSAYANPALVRYGKKCAGFWSDAGSATSAAFTPPPGVWQVRFKAAFGGNISGTKFWNDTELPGDPVWRVVVKVNGATAADSVSMGNAFGFNKWRVVQPDGAFTVASGDSVTVQIFQTNASGAGYIDDVELVPANFVANGGFETGSLGAWSGNARVGAYTSFPTRFGLDVCDGAYFAQLEDDIALEQTMRLPSAGLYRIRFQARTRTGDRQFSSVVVTVSSGSVTNSIAIVYVDTDTFRPYEYWMAVPAAGDYTLRISGVVTSNHGNSLVDEVSVVKMDGGLAAQVPTVSSDMALEVASGATVALDFPGTLELDSVQLGGRSAGCGFLSAATHPDYFVGTGTIFVRPKGTVIYMR